MLIELDWLIKGMIRDQIDAANITPLANPNNIFSNLSFILFFIKYNSDTGLNIKICYDENEAFSTFMAHYGKFEGVSNYAALIGKKGNDELIWYWGEYIVLKA